jgi:Flp pilus assembly protein TadG
LEARQEMKEKRKLIRGERGQTMTEFAIVLPIFLLLLLGIAQLGIAFNNYLALTDGVRAGARYGAVLRTDASHDPKTIAKVKQSAANLDTNQIGVTISSTWQAGSDLTVCGSYPYSINLIGLVVSSGNLNSCTTNRVE